MARTADRIGGHDDAAPHAPSLARALTSIVLLMTLFAVLVPFGPQMPVAGLDGSAAMAINVAAARGLAFGTDVVFVLGPYGSLYTRTYHPDLDLRVLCAGAVVALQCFVCIVHLTSRRGAAAFGSLAFALLWFSNSIDGLMIFAGTLVGLFAWRLSVDASSRAGPARPLVHAAVALAFASLGLLALVKPMWIVFTGSLLVLGAGTLIGHRQKGLAATAGAGFVGGTILFWCLARQPLSSLLSYLGSGIELATGYTDAMSLAGDASESWSYWAVAAFATFAVARRAKIGRTATIGHFLVVVLAFVTGSKSGFVRHDFNATIAAATLVLTLLVLRSMVTTRAVTAACLLALATAVYIDSHHARTSTADFIARSTSAYVDLWRGLADRLDGDAGRHALYARALDRLRGESQYSPTPATTDLYSNDQAHLLSTDVHWNPRPVIQSYAAFSPALAEKNRVHVARPGNPERLIVRIEPIDGRFPLLDDGPSWPELLARYQPTASAGGALYLSRRSQPASVSTRSTVHADSTLGSAIAVPTDTPMTSLRIDVRPTLAGRLATLLYRIDPLRLRVVLQDDRVRDFRLVAGLAEAGFIVSPLVEDAREAMLLWSARGTLDAKRVKSVTVLGPDHPSAFESLFWPETIGVTFDSLALEGRTDLSIAMAAQKPVDAPPGSAAVAGDCSGSIDLVNGAAVKAPLAADALLTVEGWLDRDRATATRDVFVSVTDSQGVVRYAPTLTRARPDVAAYLKRPELKDAGVAATLDLSDLAGSFTVGLAYQVGRQLVLCRQFGLSLTVQH